MIEERVSIDVLRQIPLFQGLTDRESRQIAEIARRKEFAPGDLILRQGDRSQDLWVVLDGRCEVVRLPENGAPQSDPIALALLEAHSVFGEMSFFSPAPHSASVRAQTAVRLMHVARGDYDRLVRDGASAAYKVAYNTVQSLADRLRRMDVWVADLAAQQPPSGAEPDRGEWGTFRDKVFNGWNL